MAFTEGVEPRHYFWLYEFGVDAGDGTVAHEFVKFRFYVGKLKFLREERVNASKNVLKFSRHVAYFFRRDSFAAALDCGVLQVGVREGVFQLLYGLQGGLKISAFVGLEQGDVFRVACYEVSRRRILEVCFVCGA